MKKQIIEMCNSLIIFLDDLKTLMMEIPDENKADIVYEFYNYFEDHKEPLKELYRTINILRKAKNELVMRGELHEE